MYKRLALFIPSIEEGGVEKNLYIISKFLKSKNIIIDIVTCNFNKKKKFHKNTKFIGPRSSYFFNQPRLFKTLISVTYLFFYLLKNKQKLLVFSFQSNLFSIIVCKLTNTKIIARANSSPIGWTKNIFKKYIYKFVINLADDVVVNSFEFKKDFIKYFNIKANCIYNPFDKSFIIKKLNKNKKTIFKNKSLKILTIGRLTNQKDHFTLLKAVKLIDSKMRPEIVIIGKGTNSKILKEYIFKNTLEKKIKLIGYKSNPYNYLKKTDIFILTSKYEGLPNVLLEAQFLNKYIISTNCPNGPKEILLNGEAGDLINIGDYKSLSKLINSFYINKKIIKKKIYIAKKNFYRFDYKNNCEKYLKLINKNF